MPSKLAFFALAFATAVPPAVAVEPVNVARFDAVQLYGGGNVVIRKGPVQKVTIVSGSSRFTDIKVERERKLEIRACERQCPRNYRLEVVIETPSIHALAIHGGGSLRMEGGFPVQANLAAAIHGGGKIDMRSVSAASMATAIHGGGEILAGPARSLMIAINGGGHVRYAGNPRLGTAINGGGSISRL